MGDDHQHTKKKQSDSVILPAPFAIKTILLDSTDLYIDAFNSDKNRYSQIRIF